MISIKNRSRLVLMVVAYVVLAPLNTSAITEQQRGLFSKNDISFYAGDGCTGDFTVGITGARGVGDDMLAKKGGLSARLMEIKDPAKFAEAIDKWIEKNAPDNSPFRKIKSGQLAIAGGKRAGINPILPIIISRMESSFGVYVPHPSNAYGRTATQSQPHVTVSNNRWYTWDSLEQSLYDTKNENDMYMYIKDVYSDIIDQGIVSVMTRYAPPHENDTATYVNNLNTWAKEVYDLAGDSINKDQLGAIEIPT